MLSSVCYGLSLTREHYFFRYMICCSISELWEILWKPVVFSRLSKVLLRRPHITATKYVKPAKSGSNFRICVNFWWPTAKYGLNKRLYLWTVCVQVDDLQSSWKGRKRINSKLSTFVGFLTCSFVWLTKLAMPVKFCSYTFVEKCIHEHAVQNIDIFQVIRYSSHYCLWSRGVYFWSS